MRSSIFHGQRCCPMFVQRLRHWLNAGPALDECGVLFPVRKPHAPTSGYRGCIPTISGQSGWLTKPSVSQWEMEKRAIVCNVKKCWFSWSHFYSEERSSQLNKYLFYLVMIIDIEYSIIYVWYNDCRSIWNHSSNIKNTLPAIAPNSDTTMQK